jgi:hypothetical protein
MLDPDSFPFAFEFDVVEKTIEVTVTLHGEETRIRMETLRTKGGSYFTTAYVEREIQLRHPWKHPDDVGDGEMVGARTWVVYELPWTHRPTADEALAQALSFLSERCKSVT